MNITLKIIDAIVDEMSLRGGSGVRWSSRDERLTEALAYLYWRYERDTGELFGPATRWAR